MSLMSNDEYTETKNSIITLNDKEVTKFFKGRTKTRIDWL